MKTTKAAHAEFIAAVTAELLSLGFERRDSGRPGVSSFYALTTAGPLTLTPEVPVKLDGIRTSYWLGCFGKFSDVEQARTIFGEGAWGRFNPHNGKWNWDFPGDMLPEDAVTALACALLRLILPAPDVSKCRIRRRTEEK